MTFWADRLNYKTTPISYGEVDAVGLSWVTSLGNKERFENLLWARDKLGGLMRVVIIRAADVNALQRKIREAYVNDQLVMRLVQLNESTGHFTAEAISM
jgi:hypothetical protein